MPDKILQCVQDDNAFRHLRVCNVRFRPGCADLIRLGENLTTLGPLLL
ncbi:MAG: hypothetical protein H6507_08620 [Calditrichaeota bacterium]|nr:hypothetical protein [Calditrichota bacterium]